MKYIVYKATAPNGKYYIGVTNNFKRRINEHSSSPYPFGLALRKYGKNSFIFEFEYFNTAKEAFEKEAELVTEDHVLDDNCYNICVGGKSPALYGQNPMFNRDIVDKHPNIWSTSNNPMNSHESKAKMIATQNLKKVCVKGVTYYGVREAARNIGVSRQCLVYRLKSSSFTDYQYV